MPERPRIEFAAATLVLLACGAFIASFAFGLGDGRIVTSDVALDEDSVERTPVAGRVEVLNASGRSGLARAATAELRSAGFDVVYFGNAPASAGDSSVVIARVAGDSVARAAGASIGIDRFVSRPDTARYLDATIVVGVDWLSDPEARAREGDGLGARLRRIFDR